MKTPLLPWIVCAALTFPACFGEEESATAAAGAALTAAGATAPEAGCTGEHDGEGCAMAAGAGGCAMAGGEGCAMKAAAVPAEHQHAEGEGGCSASEVCSSQVLAMAEQAKLETATAATAGGAPPPPAPADETEYGAPLALTAVTPISSLLADWEAYEGKAVQVRGTVVGVCAHRGCWMDIAGTEDFQKVRFKVNDGEMVFPITDKGRVATAEGVVTKLVIPVEQLREAYAARAEAAGEEFDPASITEPQVVWQLQGTGARIG